MSTKKETERSKLVQEKCQTLITQMLKDEDNKYCVDCDAKGEPRTPQTPSQIANSASRPLATQWADSRGAERRKNDEQWNPEVTHNSSSPALF